MIMLRHHVPIALVVDLVDPEGPRSREIYTYEAADDDVRRDLETLAVSESTDGGATDFSGQEAAC
jgi:hypothetical protein